MALVGVPFRMLKLRVWKQTSGQRVLACDWSVTMSKGKRNALCEEANKVARTQKTMEIQSIVVLAESLTRVEWTEVRTKFSGIMS